VKTWAWAAGLLGVGLALDIAERATGMGSAALGAIAGEWLAEGGVLVGAMALAWLGARWLWERALAREVRLHRAQAVKEGVEGHQVHDDLGGHLRHP
jgi:hypothetical protein